MKINDNYRYIVSVNQWALIEYFKAKKLSLDRLKEIKGAPLMVLSLIVELYLDENLKNKTFNGSQYTWMANGIFFDNLPIVFIKKAKTKKAKLLELQSLKRNLQNYLTRLIDIGIVQRVIENETTRYLKVNDIFLTKCNRGNLKLSPLVFINKYFKKDLLCIEREYKQLLPPYRYPALQEKFFDEEHYNQYMNKDFTIDKTDLFNRFKLYLNECVKDPYYKLKSK